MMYCIWFSVKFCLSPLMCLDYWMLFPIIAVWLFVDFDCLKHSTWNEWKLVRDCIYWAAIDAKGKLSNVLLAEISNEGRIVFDAIPSINCEICLKPTNNQHNFMQMGWMLRLPPRAPIKICRIFLYFCAFCRREDKQKIKKKRCLLINGRVTA